MSQQEERSGLRTVAVVAWLRLMRVFRRVEQVAAAELRCQGLSLAQFDVLARVGAAEGVIQRDIAEGLLVTKGNVTQLLGRMERCGWLERRQVGRSKRLYLTARGRALYREVVPAHEALIAAQLGALDAAEQRQLHRLLRTLDRSLERRETDSSIRRGS